MLSSTIRSSGRIFIRPLSSSTIRYQQPSVEPTPVTPVSPKEEAEAIKQSQSWNDLYVGNVQTTTTEDEIVYKPTTIKEQEPPLQISSTLTRKFSEGQVYNPFHFSLDRLHMERTQTRVIENVDPFARCGINPRNLYMMPEILSKFITSTGQILPRSKTGCSAKNQKRLSNAIKTARAIGVLSSVHKHHRFMPRRNF